MLVCSAPYRACMHYPDTHGLNAALVYTHRCFRCSLRCGLVVLTLVSSLQFYTTRTTYTPRLLPVCSLCCATVTAQRCRGSSALPAMAYNARIPDGFRCNMTVLTGRTPVRRQHALGQRTVETTSCSGMRLATALYFTQRSLPSGPA